MEVESSSPALNGCAPWGNGRNAFTLIELLVVMLIISILIGITMPAIGKVRSASQRLKCLTNLKGFGVSFELYRKDNKDLLPYVLPFHNEEFPDNPDDPQLLDALEGYMDAQPPYHDADGNLVVTEPFLCPSDTDGVGRETGFSYEYWPGVLMIGREILRGDRNPAATVSRFYEENPIFPVLSDANPWHPGGHAYDQNALFFGDWRADWLEMDPETMLEGLP